MVARSTINSRFTAEMMEVYSILRSTTTVSERYGCIYTAKKPHGSKLQSPGLQTASQGSRYGIKNNTVDIPAPAADISTAIFSAVAGACKPKSVDSSPGTCCYRSGFWGVRRGLGVQRRHALNL